MTAKKFDVQFVYKKESSIFNNNYSELFEGSIFDFKDCFILRTENDMIMSYTI